MDNLPEDAPLDRGSVAGSEEALVGRVSPRRGSNSRAFKVAGLTTLACLLLASQVFTAYMLLGQKQEIHSLQKNSEKMAKQLTRSSQASSAVRVPMNSLPLMDLTMTNDDDSAPSKTPLTKLEDTAVVSVEKQLTDFLQEVQLPQFNETLSANLQGLKGMMNESDWKSFESWMRHWLIFQMAQQKPVTHTSVPAPAIQTKCQMEASSGHGKIGSYRPQCDQKGKYLPMQCWLPTGYCWCVDENGNAIEGTSIRGHPDCRRGRARMMFAPRMMAKTISNADE
ncbi:CD74 molecule, major histocompatibility complex, class II invariant chain a [Solea solea]|uniref:CD74 molecule, major histocompatibility complex, class II invariant chain a n=1 Tax=Solea solea TaxID=90069 RepID=UPI00272B399C|nr:CD74 molecule, major histocompatibility complex, class II invariant chain a [Solea solea]